MADYSLMLNSQFHPFSYLEMLAPVALATLSLLNLEDKYEALGDLANAFSSLANLLTDPVAYTLYKKYADELSDQVDLLSKTGLTPTSRLAMLNMKRRYGAEITPIDVAYKKRDELAKELRSLRALDNSMMFDTDYSTASLDLLLANPSASYTPVSGEALAKRAAEMALPLSKIISPETNKSLKTVLGNLYALILMGASPRDVMAAINNDTTAHPELRKIIDTVYQTSGLNSFDTASLLKGMAHIIRGLYNAIGGSNPVSNGEYMNKAQRSSASLLAAGLALDREKFNYAKDKDIQEIEIAKIDHGLSPYATDKNGNKYFSNGKISWVISNNDTVTKLSTGKEPAIKTAGVSYSPAYFDAWTKSADEDFIAKSSGDDNTGYPSILYSDITGKDALNYIRSYIRKTIAGTDNLNNQSIDRLASLLDLKRHNNYLSNDNFTINIPGTNSKGKIVNTGLYTLFINNVKKEVSNPENLVGNKYNGSSNARLK